MYKRQGDIAILVPAIRLAEPYAAALAEAHIPYTMTDGKGFYEQQEVIDIITIMTAVLSPDVDWAMAGVLRSPYGGLTDQEILGLLRMYPQKNQMCIRDSFNAAFQSPSDRPAAREFYKSRPRIGLYPILHQSNDGLS